VFFHDLCNLPPALYGAASLVSVSTVMPWNVESMTVETWQARFSAVQVLLFFAALLHNLACWFFRALHYAAAASASSSVRSMVMPGPMVEVSVILLNVFAFGGSRLGLYYRVNHRMRVFCKLCASN